MWVKVAFVPDEQSPVSHRYLAIVPLLASLLFVPLKVIGCPTVADCPWLKPSMAITATGLLLLCTFIVTVEVLLPFESMRARVTTYTPGVLNV